MPLFVEFKIPNGLGPRYLALKHKDEANPEPAFFWSATSRIVRKSFYLFIFIVYLAFLVNKNIEAARIGIFLLKDFSPQPP